MYKHRPKEAGVEPARHFFADTTADSSSQSQHLQDTGTPVVVENSLRNSARLSPLQVEIADPISDAEYLLPPSSPNSPTRNHTLRKGQMAIERPRQDDVLLRVERQ